jgi:putative serine protease PepD
VILTNGHVMADISSARVVFPSGQSRDVEGIVSAEPSLDLAIIKVSGLPRGTRPLSLAAVDSSSPDSQVIACGYPLGQDFTTRQGRVKRVVRTSGLIAASRRFLSQALHGRVDQEWIEHTASLTDGNSGGPLLNAQGEVVGVNTWVDDDHRLNYALHVRHIREFLDRPAERSFTLAEYREYYDRWRQSGQ